MEPENKEQEKQEILPAETNDPDFQDMMPTMQVTMPQQEVELENLISDDELLGLYDEIIQNCRDDRKEIDGLLANFVDMVLNEGDGSNASKEAIPTLIKVKSDVNDKMSKIAEMKTRLKMRDRDTFPKYLAAHVNQKNTINISSSKRDLLKAIEKKQKQAKENK